MKFNTHYFNQLRQDKGYSQKDLVSLLESKGVGITLDGIKAWTRKGASTIPDFQKIYALAEIFEVDPMSFFEEGSKYLSKRFDSNVMQVPVIEALAGCGSAGMLEQLRYSNQNILLDTRLFPAIAILSDLSIIRIVGDSMQPFLEENDWAVIQMRNGYNAVAVDGVYLISHGQNIQIKRCSFQNDGSCKLISDNQLYPMEIALPGEWDIVGKVVARLKVGSAMLFKE